MSISATLTAALSGLSASARAAEAVAANIANARTEGYGRREVTLASRTHGGVEVTGISRALDRALLDDRRIAGAGAAAAGLAAGFLAGAESAIGLPGEPGALGSRIAALESALIAAAGRPDSDAHLGTVLAEAQGIARHLAMVGETVQTARAEADRAIAAEVGALNRSLEQVSALNAKIAATSAAGRDPSSLMDQRQQVVDRIAEIVPIREIAREGGRIALYTAGGVPLLDTGRPAQFGFTAAGTIAPDMTLASGALSGLTLNGRPIAVTGPESRIAGGTLAAHFAIRDEAAPQVQTRLDALARDLLDRFAGPDPDATLAAGAPGLFTDLGGPFDPAQEVGLAARLRVNPAADPASGGELWRLRAGLGAAAPGDPGASGLLSALADTLAAPRTVASGGFSGARSASGLAADLLSGVASARLSAEAEAGFAASAAAALDKAALEAGVDTDHELQLLLQIERAYAANARVIQTADDMIRTLLEI